MGMIVIKRICHNCLACLTSMRGFCFIFQSSNQIVHAENVSSLKHDTQKRIIFTNSRIGARKFAIKTRVEDQDSSSSSWSSSSSCEEVQVVKAEDPKPKATVKRPKGRKQSPQVEAVEKEAAVLSDAEKHDRYLARQEEREILKRYPFLIERTKQAYVLDKRLADEIVLAVRENQTDPSVPVLEANPGPGVVTRALLNSGFTRIIAAEALAKFIPYLSETVASNNNSKQEVSVLNWDHFSLYQRLTDSQLQCAYKNFEIKMAELISHKSWGDGPPLTVVGVIPATKDRRYLTHLVMSCAQQYGLFELGRPEWFLIVSPAMYKNILVQGLDDRNHYGNFLSPLGITLSLMFDIKLCGQFPGWKFVPHFTEKKKLVGSKELQGVSDSMRYLLRLRPHQEQLLPLSDFPAYHTFLYQVLKSKRQQLIVKMEQLMPGCGIHLIMSGFSMLMPILNVSRQQFLSIFKAMRSWPEYEGSPMKELLSEPSNLVLDEDHHEDSHDEKDE